MTSPSLGRARDAVGGSRSSIRPEAAYLRRVREYIPFFDKRHPSEPGAKEVGAFLSHIAVGRSAAAST